jgi:DNA polymerase III subunit gamma/tau
MEDFLVSARKYRPQSFDSVVGQQHITTTLQNAIVNQQLAHAFLFTGPRGVGKTTAARILAKTINCTNLQPQGEACNTCESCKTFNQGTSFNIHELDAASNNSVDDIRALIEQVRFAPQAGKYKIYIIDEVHMLTTQAFNAFLKTLEEPPSYAKFILATTEKHKILPTILSRCQIFDFKRITLKDTANYLATICQKENLQAADDSLHLIARKSEGCMRDALSILDKIASFTGGQLTYENTLENLNLLDEDYFFNILELAQEQNLPELMLLYDKINNKGFEAEIFINGLADFYRNVLFAYDAKTLALLEVSDSFKNKYAQWATNLPKTVCLTALQLVHEAEMQVRMARNKRLVVEMCLIKICYLAQAHVVASGGNAVVQKKINTQKVVEYKPVVSWAIKPKAEAVFENKMPAVISTNVKTAVQATTQTNVVTTNHVAEEVKPMPKMISLDKLRAKVKQENRLATNTKHFDVSLENIQLVWDKIADGLRQQNKLSTAQLMSTATLQYDKEKNKLDVHAHSVMQNTSIVQETFLINETFKQYFAEDKPFWELHLLEEEVTGAKQSIANKSTSEQYELMIKKYPAIKYLRDKLRLELDY